MLKQNKFLQAHNMYIISKNKGFNFQLKESLKTNYVLIEEDYKISTECEEFPSANFSRSLKLRLAKNSRTKIMPHVCPTSTAAENFGAWSQSYARELQRQRCKNLQRQRC
jgi:hypothetical protein